MTFDQPPYTDDLNAKRQVISKTVIRAADRLGLTTNELALIIGLSSASISVLRTGNHALDTSAKSWELAVLLVRLFRGLDAITGGDDESTLAWMRNYNAHLHSVPAASPKRTGIDGSRKLCGRQPNRCLKIIQTLLIR